jgi:hypothetical protein
MDVKPNPVKVRKCFMSQNNYDAMSDAELKNKLEIPVLLFLVWLKGKCWQKPEIVRSTF